MANTRSHSVLKDVQAKPNVKRVIMFGEEALDTLVEVTHRLQKAYHDLVEEDRPRRRTVKKKTRRRSTSTER